MDETRRNMARERMRDPDYRRRIEEIRDALEVCEEEQSMISEVEPDGREEDRRED